MFAGGLAGLFMVSASIAGALLATKVVGVVRLLVQLVGLPAIQLVFGRRVDPLGGLAYRSVVGRSGYPRLLLERYHPWVEPEVWVNASG